MTHSVNNNIIYLDANLMFASFLLYAIDIGACRPGNVRVVNVPHTSDLLQIGFTIVEKSN